MGGKLPLLNVEIDVPPVPYTDGERQEALAYIRQANSHSSTPNQIEELVPEFKHKAFSVTVDVAGRIWVRLSSVAQRVDPRVKSFDEHGTTYTNWASPPRFAGFLPDGTYLGELTLPVDAIVSFGPEAAWVATIGSDGLPLLQKFPLRIPATSTKDAVGMATPGR
jgi:hypothetical protein